VDIPVRIHINQQQFKKPQKLRLFKLAEREGFEPSREIAPP
jgi:hypothetical protein